MQDHVGKKKKGSLPCLDVPIVLYKTQFLAHKDATQICSRKERPKNETIRSHIKRVTKPKQERPRDKTAQNRPVEWGKTNTV